MQLLNEKTVIDYLIDHQVINQNDEVIVEELDGGVSNTVLAIKTNELDLVLKQALPLLKVEQHWEADQRRAIVEANALDLYHSITPDQVPKLIYLDPSEFVLVMQRVPKQSKVWRTELLSGNFSPKVAQELGRTLAKWHHYGENNIALLNEFREDDLFEQLRVDPFYRFVALKNPSLQAKIYSLINELEQYRTTLVHGDFSPKNIMISLDGRVYVLDYEVTHLGNPVFDLAFLLGHLVCKFFRANRQDEKMLDDLANQFVSSYHATRQLPASLVHHTALISLARVEGKSPVNYLDLTQQKKLSTFTKEILSQPAGSDIGMLFDSGAK